MFKKMIMGMVLLIGTFNSIAQTYTVTSQDLGSANSLDYILTQAIPSANAGNNVTILFDAPALVRIESSQIHLQVTISAGSITFDRKTNGSNPTVEQGFQFVGDINDGYSNEAISVISNSASSAINFKNLKFADFKGENYNAPNAGRRNCIYLYNANNVTIQGCKFVANSFGITFDGNNIKIDHCEFQDNWIAVEPSNILNNIEISSNNFILGSTMLFGNGIAITPTNSNQTAGTSTTTTSVNIHHNTFTTNAAPAYDGTMIDVRLLNILTGEIKIEDNAFSGGTEALSVRNMDLGKNVNPLTTIGIRRNTFSQTKTKDLIFFNPLSYWKVEGNSFNSKGTSVQLYSTYDLPNTCGISFIEPNTLNSNLNNRLNTFGTAGEESFLIQGNFGGGNQLFGLTLNLPVVISRGSHSTVRASKIKATPGGFKAIDLVDDFGYGNDNITAPVIQSVSALSGSNFSVTYQLSNLNSSNSDFVVDFFTTNANGDIGDYIGNQTVSGNGTYTAPLTLPTGVSLDLIGATVTSLGNISGHLPIGTSEISSPFVANTCYTANINFDMPYCPGGKSDARFSIDLQGTHPANFTWNFGDGQSQTLSGNIFDSYHTYATTGNYTVTLNYQVAGCPVKTVTKSIQVSNPVHYLTASPTTVNFGDPVVFTFSASFPNNPDLKFSYSLNLGDGNPPIGFPVTPNPGTYTWTPLAPGTYTVTLTSTHAYSDVSCKPTDVIIIRVIDCTDCTPIECKDCIGSFSPEPGEEYVVSAWVRQSNSEQEMTYGGPAIGFDFTGGSSQGPFFATGAIIDGWQRIDATFTIPALSSEVFVKLMNTGSKEVYFDDLRIQPLKASLKSFVYDPITMKLMAELDENNYATFYEYDEEGALIRVKKETERGIKTIKETGNNIRKK